MFIILIKIKILSIIYGIIIYKYAKIEEKK